MTEPGTPQDRSPRRNRLAGEHSPYLLQHATNPVDWYPWGEEAFEQARTQNKPIFLSVGYSSCHWCHVMAHESFEDAEVAELLNQSFVPVKVDREERPDIDNVYMSVCQMMTGSGGWPLTIIMTPEGRPFFAATYVPKENRFGRVGLLELIPRVSELWRKHRKKALALAAEVEAMLGRASSASPATDAVIPSSTEHERGLYSTMLDTAYVGLSEAFDEQHGGFGGPPKFPSPHNLFFLLRYWRRSGRPEALAMVERTLYEMRRGGIYDHVGFGFHRYSTDDRWLVPHFEKMLYDQALLAVAYTEAFQATRNPLYRRTTEEILTYVLRDLASGRGGFFSAEDADSEGEEGRFYLWEAKEFREAAGADAALAAGFFNVTEAGNVSGHPAGLPGGANVLHLGGDREDPAPWAVEPAELERRIEAVRRALFAKREGRVRPLRDHKVLTDWNGLAIVALSFAARALGRPAYAGAARRAAEFVLANLGADGGRLRHVWSEGEAAVGGCLDDYAFLVWGLVELYQTVFDPCYLEAALELNQVMLERFAAADGGFYFTPDDGEKLLVRQKQVFDGAMPSGNSVALVNLVRLARLTGDSDLETRAGTHARWLYGVAHKTPLAHVHALVGLDLALGPSSEVIVAGDQGAEDTSAMLGALGSVFLPNNVVLLIPGEPGAAAKLRSMVRYAGRQERIGGKATAYVCRNFACERPTADPAKMLELVTA